MDKTRVLLLGSTGKMGLALNAAFAGSYDLVGMCSRDFDAQDPDAVRALVAKVRPDILINTVACLGVDACEQEPARAFRLNTLYPKLLAELAESAGFRLVHFSSDGVFNDDKQDYHVESDPAAPLHLYGLTKYGADCAIAAATPRHYIFRIPVLFGETSRDTQFVERMIQAARASRSPLRVAADIVSSPTYSRDVAGQVREVLEAQRPFGLYHVANAGMASLHELISEIVSGLKFPVVVEPASYRDFPHRGRKNTFSPIRSAKIAPLRPWRDAVREYCSRLREARV